MKKFVFIVLALASAMSARAQLITSTTTVSERQVVREKTDLDIWYQGEFNIGDALMRGQMKWSSGNESGKTEKTDFSRVFISTIHGVRITRYAFAGLGVGAQYIYGKTSPDYDDDLRWNTLLIPTFINLKGYYPVTDDFSPYISASLGTTFCALSEVNEEGSDWSTRLKGGFYGEFALGYHYNSLNFAFGLQTLNLKIVDSYEYQGYRESDSVKFSSPAFFVKVGFKF